MRDVERGVMGAGVADVLDTGGSSGPVQATTVKETARLASRARRILSTIEAPLDRGGRADDARGSMLLEQLPMLLVDLGIELGHRAVDRGEVLVVEGRGVHVDARRQRREQFVLLAQQVALSFLGLASALWTMSW
jgi:hypothetical protein